MPLQSVTTTGKSGEVEITVKNAGLVNQGDRPIYTLLGEVVQCIGEALRMWSRARRDEEKDRLT